MDIIVTTPKSQMDNAAKEARDIKKAGGGFYFRCFRKVPKGLSFGDRVFYVENGFITGYCKVHSIERDIQKLCATTGRQWPVGEYIMMDATTWTWIAPIKMRGFNLAYKKFCLPETRIVVMGDWQAERPRSCRVCGCTQNDACVNPMAKNCCWVEKDLCSHCRDYPGEAKRFSEKYSN